MFVRPLRHLGRNIVAYVALFFALSGSATAAGVVMFRGDPAGGDLTGTYPNPQLAEGAITFYDDVITSDLEPIPPGSCPGFGRFVPGLRPNDLVIARPIQPSQFIFPVGLVTEERVEGDYALVYLCNVTGQEIDPVETTFRIVVIR